MCLYIYIFFFLLKKCQELLLSKNDTIFAYGMFIYIYIYIFIFFFFFFFAEKMSGAFAQQK